MAAGLLCSLNLLFKCCKFVRFAKLKIIFTNIFLITESLRLCPVTQASLDGVGPTKPTGWEMSLIDM